MKIIVSNKCKNHMRAHKNDFLVPWDELIEECKIRGVFNELNKSLEIRNVKFNRAIGYCNLVEVSANDEIMYARRKGRDIYTKFVKNRKAEITNNLVIILNRSYTNEDEYYLITLFAGVDSIKEPEDRNIGSKVELQQSLDFWNGHALVYDEKIIDIESIKTYCPYKNLYLAIA